MQRYRSLFRWRHLLWPPRFRPYAVPVQMIDDTKSCSPQEGTTTRIVCDWEKWIESWAANNLCLSSYSPEWHICEPGSSWSPDTSGLVLAPLALSSATKQESHQNFVLPEFWQLERNYLILYVFFFVATVFTCSFFHRAELPQSRRKAHLECLKW